MWIICENGEAVNTDYVTRFWSYNDICCADIAGLVRAISLGMSADKIETIIRNINSGTKYMNFNRSDNNE